MLWGCLGFLQHYIGGLLFSSFNYTKKRSCCCCLLVGQRRGIPELPPRRTALLPAAVRRRFRRTLGLSRRTARLGGGATAATLE